MNKVIFYGFAGHGQVVETALNNGMQLAGFFDLALPRNWAGKVPYMGKYDPTVLRWSD